jgi:hypothetical protein
MRKLYFQVKSVIGPEIECIELKTSSPLSETSLSLLETSSPSLGTLHKDTLLRIFEMLEMKSMVAVARTCKYFQSIYESVKKPMDIYHIKLDDMVVDWELCDFKYALKYISQYLIKSSSKCPTEALSWIQEKEVTAKLLILLEWFVSKYPQASTLFLKGQSIFFGTHEIHDRFLKLKSLKYLCISGGSPSQDWSWFLGQFKKLELVYFAPGQLWKYEEKILVLDTEKTVFIMDSVDIILLFGEIK